jgi:hypothetical protein
MVKKMNNNKVLVKLYAVEYGKVYDVYIPVNYLVWKITKLLIKCIGDLSDIEVDLKKEYILVNKTTNEIYTNNSIIREKDIRNGTELIIISK